jgi:hypothetical protein
MESNESSEDFLRTLRGTVLASIPALSALVFFTVTVKVFRVARMETVTTVAIVSSANPVELLKGVILTLLPGFLAGVVAAGVWWWSGSMDWVRENTPEDEARRTAQQSLTNPRAVLMWSLMAMAFFTISWTAFLGLFLPVVACVAILFSYSRGRKVRPRSLLRMRSFLKAFGVLVGVVSIAWLALSPQVWIPERKIELQPGHAVSANGADLPPRFAAYVLGEAKGSTSLLMDKPRAVVYVPTQEISPNPPLCIHPNSPLRWMFLRPSQILHLDSDYGSPYVLCP